MEVFGDVYIGKQSFVASNTVLRAAPDQRLDIGNETNAQDNVIVRSLVDSSRIGDETSLAHHAIVRDSRIGNFTFLGFDAEIIDSTIEDGALISAGALIENVTIPEDALVPPGAEITTQEDADALESVTEANEEFKREVLDVNAEFAESYITLYEEEGYDNVVGVGPNPTTSFNAERVEPEINDAELGEFVRILGDVQLGSGSKVGERAAIRADEGSPITIGEDAEIEEQVTFHALKDTNIEVGDSLTVGDDSVIHGPIEIGDNVTVGDDSVVFRVRVGDDVVIGDDVTVQGTASEDGELELDIPDGANIPDGAVITSQEELDAIVEQQGQQQGQGKEKEKGKENEEKKK
ncbi:MAG: carbonate dehydratase [Rubrobacter sp.]|nr:carbonate dehydratase [Rubrobacter sp.]